LCILIHHYYWEQSMKKYLLPALAISVLLPLGVQAQPPQGPGAGPGAGDPGNAFLDQLDGNKDGAVSKDEFMNPQVQAFTQQLEQQFKYMDKNSDGKVDAAEAATFIKEMQQRMEQMQQQQGGAPKAR
jgi:hypothetical protein